MSRRGQLGRACPAALFMDSEACGAGAGLRSGCPSDEPESREKGGRIGLPLGDKTSEPGAPGGQYKTGLAIFGIFVYNK